MVYKRILKLSPNRSFFLFGARATGKSTLLETWVRTELKKSHSQSEILEIDLLDPSMEEKYSLYPSRLKEELNTDKYKYCLIDEIQKVPALLDVAHWAISKKKIVFAITGSSARKLKRGGANLLAGRAFDHKLFPLTHREIGKDFNLNDTLRYGSLPEVLSLKPEDKERYLESYTRTYLKEEIQVERLVRNVQKFRKFLSFASQMNTKTLSFSTLSEKSGVDAKSISRYFEILEDTLIGYFLEPYDKSIRSRQKQKPKFYLFDTGIACQLREDFTGELLPSTSLYGELFEQWIVTECMRLSHYYEVKENFFYLSTKDHAEIDLVIERRGQLPILIEIKSSEQTLNSHKRHLVSFMKSMKYSRAILVCQEKKARTTEEGIEILPWNIFFNELYPSLK